jgi:hypothetical protein
MNDHPTVHEMCLEILERLDRIENLVEWVLRGKLHEIRTADIPRETDIHLAGEIERALYPGTEVQP